MTDLDRRLGAALEKLTKWRSVFAGWQLGTRNDTDAECQAVRDHREVTILLRAEVTALVGVLIKKDVFTLEEFQEQLLEEVEALDQAYARRFPGITSTEHGMAYDVETVAKHGTMKGWRP